MALTEWNRLCKHIIACAQQINKENFMVFDQTEDSLVVVSCALWAERNDDSLRRVGLDDSLSHWKRVHVALVCEELERRGQIAVIDHVQQAVCRLLCLHLSKVYRLRAQLHIVSISYAAAVELDLVASKSGNFEKCEAADAGNLRSVSDSYFYDLAWADLALYVIHLDCHIFSVVIHLLYRVSRGN